MKRPNHVVGFVAHCKHCAWLTEDHIKGPKAASAHARHTGHIVTGERTRYAVYGKPENRPERDQREKYR